MYNKPYNGTDWLIKQGAINSREEVMIAMRTLLWLAVRGILVGALLAFAGPQNALTAEEGCRCNDYGSGNYSCSSDQTACLSGSQVCNLYCQ